MVNILITMAISAGIVLLLGPILIPLLHKLKYNSTVLTRSTFCKSHCPLQGEKSCVWKVAKK